MASARAQRRIAVHWTRLNGKGQGVWTVGDDAPVGLANALEERTRSGRSGIVSTPQGEIFLNVHVPTVRLVLIGAVHISQALAPMAAACELSVVVIDPRTAFATPERFENTELHAEWPDDVPDALALDEHTALAALTHDPKIDDGPLRAALNARCFYVGALGSRKTHAKRRARFADMDDEAFARIAAPIGLDIGAATPAEIAVAILAQIVAARRQ